jgi:hypothetical protein
MEIRLRVAKVGLQPLQGPAENAPFRSCRPPPVSVLIWAIVVPSLLTTLAAWKSLLICGVSVAVCRKGAALAEVFSEEARPSPFTCLP